jgi:Glycosyl hydrolase catalytic core/Bacterial Ig-like domain (group 2)
MTNPAIKPRRLTWLVIAGIAIAMSACGGGQGNQGMSSAGSSVAPSAPSLLSIAIMPTRTTIAAGATLQFTATGTYSDKSTQTLTNAVTWNSSSTGVATFSSSSNSPGLATAANPGSTSIVASSGTITSPAVTLTVIAAMPAAKSAKRGVAYDLADPSDFAALSPGVSWWYNWSPRPNVQAPIGYVAQYKMDFYPMLWNGSYDAAAIETFLLANPGIKFLLVVNEPNIVTQANLTPQQAADLWPGFEAIAVHTGVKIVGPAITWGTMPGYADPVVWLDAFYAAYQSANGGREPQIDYIAFHWYDYGLGAQLDRLTKYGKPFWVTEFANWHSQADGAQIDTAAKQEAQMTDMVAICESRADVARYAWFTGRMSNDAHFTSLLAAPGQLTALGHLYLSLPYSTP